MGRGVVPGVSLKDDRGCTTQTGEFAVFGDAKVRGSAGEHRSSHLFLNDGAKARPGGSKVAGDENDLGRERCGDETESAAQMCGLTSNGGDGRGVAFFSQAQEIVNVECAALWNEFGVVAKGRSGRREDLPAATLTAAADGAGGVDGTVAELAGEAAAAGDDLQALAALASST
jgi:hypothetical protein